ncbi:hypothetical protein AX16_000099 [Volvariella volvacea WC 439]|nr:hypothetical protein AX16_000099 [Volvariella volvacea WC 439]
MSPLRNLRKNWFAVEAVPIYVIIGSVVAGGTWYLTRLATGPTVVWTKSNPTPWNTIKPEEGTKLLAVNQKFEKRSVVAFLAVSLSAERAISLLLLLTILLGCVLDHLISTIHIYLEMPSLFEPGQTLVPPPDEAEDFPVPGLPLTQLEGPLRLPALVYGAGTFSNQYNSDNHLASQLPIRTVRLALRYGIRAFDTSVYYGPSEIVLGNALKSLENEFPRSSYQLMTKCGRYGPLNFDYTPTTIRDTVKRSLERLQTGYLDTVYLHDVEFVCTPIAPRTSGNHSTAIGAEKAEYGLAEGEEGKIRGEGDQKILDAFAELQKLQEAGLIKHIGITGYPLPTLLRLALLIFHNPPFKPVDVILSYSHLTLQNQTFLEFAPQFYERAKVKQLLAASPLSMALLTKTPPPWHPAPRELHQAAQDAISGWSGDFPNLALGYSIRNTGAAHGNMPLVVGFSSPREVHECVKVWREIQENSSVEEREQGEEEARDVFRRAGYLDWSWASPGP